MSVPSRVEEVKRAAYGRWRDLLTELYDPRVLSGKQGPCPFCQGGEDRFVFDDKRHERGDGGFFCRTCGAGDGLDMVQRALGVSTLEALDWTAEKVLTVAHQPRSLPRFDAEKALRDLRRLKRYARPLCEGDLSYRYLAGRGLSMSLLYGGLSRSLWTVAEPRLWDTDTHAFYPGMLALITDSSGRAITVHRTLLQEDGGLVTKAAVLNPKKVMPVPDERTISGGAVRLSEVRGGVLALSEGLETALYVTEAYGLSCWATVSAQGMASFEVPVGVTALHIFTDNDSVNKRTGELGRGSYTGQVKAWALVGRLRADPSYRDLEIHVNTAPLGTTDFLEELDVGARGFSDAN